MVEVHAGKLGKYHAREGEASIRLVAVEHSMKHERYNRVDLDQRRALIGPADDSLWMARVLMPCQGIDTENDRAWAKVLLKVVVGGEAKSPVTIF